MVFVGVFFDGLVGWFLFCCFYFSFLIRLCLFLCNLLEYVNENSNSRSRRRYMVKINWEKLLSYSLSHPEQKKDENHYVHRCRASPSCIRSRVWQSVEVLIDNISHCTLSAVKRKVSVYRINCKQTKKNIAGALGM